MNSESFLWLNIVMLFSPEPQHTWHSCFGNDHNCVWWLLIELNHKTFDRKAVFVQTQLVSIILHNTHCFVNWNGNNCFLWLVNKTTAI